VTLSH